MTMYDMILDTYATCCAVDVQWLIQWTLCWQLQTRESQSHAPLCGIGAKGSRRRWHSREAISKFGHIWYVLFQAFEYTVYIYIYEYWILLKHVKHLYCKAKLGPHTAEAASVAAGIVGGVQFFKMAITFTYLHFSCEVRLQAWIGSVAAVLLVACWSSAMM